MYIQFQNQPQRWRSMQISLLEKCSFYATNLYKETTKYSSDSQKLFKLPKYRLPISCTKPWDQFTSKNPNLQVVVGKLAKPYYFFRSVDRLNIIQFIHSIIMILFRMFSYKKSVFFACRLPGIIHWEMGCLFTKSIPAILATHSGGANVKATLVSFLTAALSKVFQGMVGARKGDQTKCLEMLFLKTDISWQLDVIGSPIAYIFLLFR